MYSQQLWPEHPQAVYVLDRTAAHSLQRVSELLTVMAKMRYHDRYVREQGAWRFAERRLRFWYMQPLEDLQVGLSGSLRRRWPGEPMATQLPETLDTWQNFYGTADV